MRFSIITITYNAEKYLEETLTSTLKQSFTDFEHILWDGGSKDKTLQIAKKFPHVRVVEGEDEGISDAMNQGALQAKGDFLLHLHADDILVSEKSLLFVDTCLRQHPGVKWLYGQVECIDGAGKTLSLPPYVPFCKRKLKKYNIIAHPATFVERELFLKSGGFKKELSYCMDYDLWLRLSKQTEAFAFPKVVAAFRQHEGSISTKGALAVAKEAHQVRVANTKNFFAKWRSYRTWQKRKKRVLHDLFS